MPPVECLAVAIVCKNNEPTIGRVLESVRGLVAGGGEIVAVDSGSTDATIPLLEAAGARVIRTAWKGHVATKQMALDAADRPWVLCLDSDEPVQPDLADSITAILARNDPAVAGARVNRKIWYAGRFLEHAWQPEWRLRLVRKGQAFWTGLDPHDRLELKPGAGRTIDLKGTLRHDSFVTFVEHLGKQVAHGRTSAQSMHNAGQHGSYWRLLVSPPGAMFKQLVLKGAWRDGWRGWLAAGSTAAGALFKHMALIELSNTPPAPPGAKP